MHKKDDSCNEIRPAMSEGEPVRVRREQPTGNHRLVGPVHVELSAPDYTVSTAVTLILGAGLEHDATTLAAAIARISLSFTCTCENNLRRGRNVSWCPGASNVTFNTQVYLRTDGYYTAKG